LGFNLYDSDQVSQLSNPFLLNPSQDHFPEEIERNQDPQFPQYDAEAGTWVAPFFMGAINTRVVRRSFALFELFERRDSPFNPNLTYQEYLKFDSPWGWLPAAGITASMALFAGGAVFDSCK
jgi:hypothetical protein